MSEHPVAPTPSPPPGPPVSRQLQLDRAGLERVLARAAELQASLTDSHELLSETQLIEIGREVGLSPQHVRQALAEERARVAMPEAQDAVSRLFGPSVVQARRTMHGEPAALLASLDGLMQREESLQVKRRFQDRILWEPRKGFLSEMQRTLDFGGRGYHLCRAHEVAASVVPVDQGRVLVHLTSDIRPARSHRLLAGGALTGSGAAATAILLLLGVFAPVAAGATLVGVGSGYLVARAHGPLAERVHLALEQVLDRLERGEPPRRGLLSDLKKNVGGIRDL